MNEQNLKIGIIGAYGGQGRRILLHSYGDARKEFYVYEHNVKKKRENIDGINYSIKSDLDSLLLCDGIIVASPTASHFYYMNYFIERGYEGYIFCEKPPVETKEELRKLRYISDEQKKRILFGFNLRFSVCHCALEGKLKYDLGELRHCSILSGHGLGYKNIYAGSWRNDKSKVKNGIFETVGIHYLDMFINRFGKPEKSFFVPSIKAQGGVVWDNYMYNAVFDNGVTLNIFNSYVSPYIDETKMLFENGIVEINQKSLKIFYPRDCFDSNNQYIMPPVVYAYDFQGGLWEESQKNILNTFYSAIVNKTDFPETDFERSMETTEYIIQE